MKELSIEEKSRRYDETIEIAKAWYDCEQSTTDDKILLKRIFSELAESEDESIRNGLIGYFRAGKCENISSYHGISTNDILAWLEKQGEHNNFIDKIQVGDKVTRNEDGMLVNLSQLNRVAKKDEKQGEQKPIDNLTPQEAMDIAVAKCFEEGEQNPTDKVETKFHEGDSIQFKGFGHNRYTIKEVCGLSHYINTMGNRMDMSYTDANFEVIEDSDKIKLSSTWSEEDEEMMATIEHHLNNCGTSVTSILWLKSLKDRYTWKPSDEQMLALEAKLTIPPQSPAMTSALIELYEQLKKLREE